MRGRISQLESVILGVAANSDDIAGVIREDSAGKAAAIMTAPDPSTALRQNELAAPCRGTVPLKAIPARIQRELKANPLLMTSLGFQGTPGIVSRYTEGGLRKANGMPRGGTLSKVLGPRYRDLPTRHKDNS